MSKRWLLALIPAVAVPCSAANFADDATRAEKEGLTAVTIFVDADFGGRKDHAAKQLTRAHGDFATRGYVVIDVESYTENGDLQGFFVTYRKESRTKD